MFAWLSKNWQPLALGLGAGAVLGFVIHPKSAAASSSSSSSPPPNLPPAPTPTPAPAPASGPITVSLQPGQTTVSPAVGQTVTISLPAGSRWVSGTLNGTTQALTGSDPFSFQAPPGAMAISLVWLDIRGHQQSTIVNVVPS